MKDGALKQFQLVCPCARCHRMKISCTRGITCDQCGTKHNCEPSSQEAINRARLIMKGLMDGTYFHNDVLKYQIHLQYEKCHSKSFLRATETRDIYKRLIAAYGERKSKFYATLEKLPPAFKILTNKFDTFKVEWMFGGDYKVYTSPKYASNIMKDIDIIDMANRNKLPPKLVDHGNTGISDIMFRVWNESLFSPLTEANAKVPVYWKILGEVTWTNICMFSWISGHDGVLTLTIMNRVTRVVLP